jgi:tRNA G18 (ribose-2'-O)-methylase SpoU
MRSNVNLSRIVRAASCCGVERIIACGKPRIDPKIARDGAERVKLELKRSLPPVIVSLRKESYQVVALEQTSCSRSLHDFRFERKTALVIGHERLGIDEESLGLIDVAVEIPVYGLPYSYNVATATSMALYEYCRQFPAG